MVTIFVTTGQSTKTTIYKQRCGYENAACVSLNPIFLKGLKECIQNSKVGGIREFNDDTYSICSFFQNSICQRDANQFNPYSCKLYKLSQLVEVG